MSTFPACARHQLNSGAYSVLYTLRNEMSVRQDVINSADGTARTDGDTGQQEDFLHNLRQWSTAGGIHQL